MKPIDIIAGVVAWVLLLIASVVLFEGPRAQSRYDPDNQWVRKTLKAERHKHHDEVIEIIERPKPRRHWHDHEHRHRYDGPRREHVETHRETRVYGVTMRQSGFAERDATSHVVCYPPINGRSNERSSQDEAWGDAQLDWANAVRWTYGERFADLRNANPVQRQCSPSTVKESYVGKLTQNLKEAVSGNTEVASRWRCIVRAGPCQAPLEGDPEIKGDKVR